MEIGKLKPLFIIGAGYSGTSILYKMLALHPDLAWFSQYSLRGGQIPGRFGLPCYKYFNRILHSFLKHSWSKEESGLKIIPRPGEAHRILGYVFPRDEELSLEEHVKRLKMVLESECKDWNKNNILVKSIRFRKYLPVLESAFSEAKFVHIIRDGRAIAISRKYKGNEKTNIDKYAERARAWTKAIETISAEIPKIDALEFKYEDFCQDVRGYLKKILNFAGLDADKFPFDKCPETLDPTNQKWFQMATKEEIALFEDIQKEILKKYGYI